MSSQMNQFGIENTSRRLPVVEHAEMGVSLFADESLQSDGILYTSHTVSGPGCPHGGIQINIKVGHVV